MEAGRNDLADRIDWVATHLGDGLGYDIVSFDENGSELFLELKTTNAGILTPFFFSPNEIALAERLDYAYRLYRVFDFSTSPHAYVLCGPLEHKLNSKPQVYSAVPTTNGEEAVTNMLRTIGQPQRLFAQIIRTVNSQYGVPYETAPEEISNGT
jgi:hypothetical protein